MDYYKWHKQSFAYIYKEFCKLSEEANSILCKLALYLFSINCSQHYPLKIIAYNPLPTCDYKYWKSKNKIRILFLYDDFSQGGFELMCRDATTWFIIRHLDQMGWGGQKAISLNICCITDLNKLIEINENKEKLLFLLSGKFHKTIKNLYSSDNYIGPLEMNNYGELYFERFDYLTACKEKIFLHTIMR